MKKVLMLCLFALSLSIFASNLPTQQTYMIEEVNFDLVPNGQNILFFSTLESDKKSISLNKENDNLIYILGESKENGETEVIKGVPGENLFYDSTYSKEFRANIEYVRFKVENKNYVLVYINSYGRRADIYLLEIYEKGNNNPVYVEKLNIWSTYDRLFKRSNENEQAYIYNVPDEVLTQKDFGIDLLKEISNNLNKFFN